MKILYVSLLIFVSFIECSADHHLRGPVSQAEFNHKRYGGSSSGGGFGAFILGWIIFPCSIAILWYNERRHLISQTRIDAAMKDCQQVNCAEVDPRCNGKLIHTNGRTSTNSLVVDSEFGVSEVNCVKIDRVVEMFQWVEHRHEDNNKRVYYTYSQEWRSEYINSGQFSEYGHTNDQSKWTVKAQELLNPIVNLGAYLLSDSLKTQCSNKQPIQLNQENARIAQANYGGRGHQIIQNAGEFIMFQQMQNQTTIGDLRISFQKVPVGETTVVSQQTANTFQPYVFHDKFDQTIANSDIDNVQPGCCCCCACIKGLSKPITDIDWIFEKIMDKNMTFKEKLNEEQCITHVMRLVGWFVMALSFAMIFSPITSIIAWFPLFGNFLAGITSFIFWIISFAIATPLSLVIIALAWLYYRPLIGVLMLTVAGLGIAGIVYYIQLQSQAQK